jgi:hypothetical protein
MLKPSSLPSVVRFFALLAAIGIGCGAPHSGSSDDDAVGSVAQAVSFAGIGDPTQIVPGLQCVTNDAASGHFVGIFRAQNPTSSTIVVPLGASNSMAPAPLGPSQPTSFTSGTRYFSIGFPVGGSITWTIGGHSVTASGLTPACTVTPGALGPVVQVGSVQVPVRLNPATVLADTIQPTETAELGLAQSPLRAF